MLSKTGHIALKTYVMHTFTRLALVDRTFFTNNLLVFHEIRFQPSIPASQSYYRRINFR
jgi:hypothetical protein